MEQAKPDIIKAAGILINGEGQLLVVRRKESDLWISLGGKPDGDESLEEALIREVKEEVGLDVVDEPVLYHVSPTEPAAGKPGLTVQISSFLIKANGEPVINPEDRIEEFHWLSKADYESGDYKLGSVLDLFVIPKLIASGLMS